MFSVCSSAENEPLFYVQSDEEVDVSVDEIYTDPEFRASAHSDTSLASTGVISSISSHGSPEPPVFEVNDVGSSADEAVNQEENFRATFHIGQNYNDESNNADGQVNAKMGLLKVEEEQEGMLYRPLFRKQGLKLKKILRSPFGNQLEMQIFSRQFV